MTPTLGQVTNIANAAAANPNLPAELTPSQFLSHYVQTNAGSVSNFNAFPVAVRSANKKEIYRVRFDRRSVDFCHSKYTDC